MTMMTAMTKKMMKAMMIPMVMAIVIMSMITMRRLKIATMMTWRFGKGCCAGNFFPDF